MSRTIKSILEEYYYKANNEFDDRHDISNSVDQALSEIEELIDGAKPVLPSVMTQLQDHAVDMYITGTNEYQENIRKVMK